MGTPHNRMQRELGSVAREEATCVFVQQWHSYAFYTSGCVAFLAASNSMRPAQKDGGGRVGVGGGGSNVGCMALPFLCL
jgi:hypothetical protein